VTAGPPEPGAPAIYAKPFLYDVAFGYRDFAREADLLAAWYRRAARTADGPRSVLELASGPADHAAEFAARGARAAAIDLSPAMCEYARRKAAARGISVEVHCGDMIEFALPLRFDLALLMISSTAHIYTLDAFVRHLRTVAAHLAPQGAYILEMPHPSDFLRPRGPAPKENAWTERRDGIEVEVRWGSEDDPYDPLAQILEARVRIAVRDGVREEIHNDTCRMRDWTATELEAAVRLSGAFEIAEQHGAWTLDAPFDSSPASWRMITVLRRRPGEVRGSVVEASGPG
jgi:SAM-dependent methyltransferase